MGQKVALLEELVQFGDFWLRQYVLEAFAGRVPPENRRFVQILKQVLSNLEARRVRERVESRFSKPLK